MLEPTHEQQVLGGGDSSEELHAAVQRTGAATAAATAGRGGDALAVTDLLLGC